MRRRAILLLAVLLFFCSGCASGGGGTESLPEPSAVSSEPTPSGELQNFSVAYSRDDTLNPYTAATEVNRQLAGLLYDNLTAVGDGMMPVNSLAFSVTQKDATHWAAILRSDAVFSDGTAVTPEDVAASFRAARAGGAYRELLSNVTGVSVDRRTGEITFSLAKPDPQAAVCLSFPVMKASTATGAKGEAPLGGGLYVLEKGEDGARLRVNPHTGKKPRYDTVYLRHLPNSDAMYYGLSSGSISYYYDDLADGVVPRVPGASAAVDMNALLFLGVNTGRTGLDQASVRCALSRALDRRVLATTACSGWAVASAYPVHPHWGLLREKEEPAPVRDLTGAVTALEAVGYGADHRLSLELIYSTDGGNRAALAETVRSQLEGAGVTVTVTPLGYADYQARLKSGKYDLYIGDVRLTAAMDLTPLFSGRAAYGISAASPAAQAYDRWRDGTDPLDAFLTAFAQDMPYIPLGWRCGFAAYDRRLTTVTPHGYNAYYGMENWY